MHWPNSLEPLIKFAQESEQVCMPNRYFYGFTLAELLIALMILGEIATFTIPKILSSQQNAQRKAIFKESISAISEALNTGFMSGELDPPTNTSTYFLSKINAVKVCDTNSTTQGCWITASQGTPAAEGTEPGLILHNGAVIIGFNNNSDPANGLVVDWNGTTGPNTRGDDQIYVGYCQTATCGGGWLYGNGARVRGAVGLSRYANATDISAFEALYQ